MQQGVICILDILGTKGIWTESSVEKYFDIISDIETNVLAPAKEKFKNLITATPLELDFLSFSDTLVITLMKTKKDDFKDDYLFNEVIEGFSQLVLGIFQHYFSESLFLRGAISFGEMQKKRTHFVGPAVDDAAEYFELPDMIGVCFTPKATIAMEYALGWNRKFFQKEIGQHVMKYKTPLKNKSEIDLYQINWPKDFYSTHNKSDMNAESTLSIFFSKRNIPLLALSKYTNSLKFFSDATKNFR